MQEDKDFFNIKVMKIRKTVSSLSLKRMVISLVVLCLLPGIERLVLTPARDTTLALAFTLNLIGCILIIYDWELVGVHYNRAKKKPSRCIAWTIVGIVLIGFWMFIAMHFLHASPVFPEKETMSNSLSITIAAIPAFSFVQACIVNLSFKCLTDHISVRQKEELVILLSGFLFGTLYTVLFLPMSIEVFLPLLLYNILLVCILSYLYNQSGNLVPGTMAMTVCYLIYILWLFLF